MHRGAVKAVCATRCPHRGRPVRREAEDRLGFTAAVGKFGLLRLLGKLTDRQRVIFGQGIDHVRRQGASEVLNAVLADMAERCSGPVRALV